MQPNDCYDPSYNGQLQQPSSQMLGIAHVMQQSSDVEKALCFRQFVVRNNTPGDIRLIDVRFSPKLPLWPNTMALTDDVGVSAVVKGTDLASQFSLLAVSSSAAVNVSDIQQRQRHNKNKLSRKQRQLQARQQQQPQQQPQQQAQQQQQPQQQQQSVQCGEPKREGQHQHQQGDEQAQSGQSQPKPVAGGISSSLQTAEAEAKRQDGVQSVLLRPKDEYPVTDVLNCLDGPHRK